MIMRSIRSKATMSFDILLFQAQTEIATRTIASKVETAIGNTTSVSAGTGAPDGEDDGGGDTMLVVVVVRI